MSYVSHNIRAPLVSGELNRGQGNQCIQNDDKLADELVRDYYPHTSNEFDPSKPKKRILQHLEFLRGSFPNIHDVQGLRVLDVACGSRNYADNAGAQYDPWMSRILLHLGAIPTGIDLNAQRDERFESYEVDLLVADSLAVLENRLFDAYYICAFPTVKCVQSLASRGLSWPAVRDNIVSHLERRLTSGGRVIRTFNDTEEQFVKKFSCTPEATMPPWQRYFDEDDDDLWLVR